MAIELEVRANPAKAKADIDEIKKSLAGLQGTRVAVAFDNKKKFTPEIDTRVLNTQLKTLSRDPRLSKSLIDTKPTEESLARLANKSKATSASVSQDTRQMASGFEMFSSSLKSAATSLAAFAATYTGAASFARLSDDLVKVSGALRGIGFDAAQVENAFSQIGDIALAARAPIAAVTDLYLKVSQASKSFGISQKDAVRSVELISKTMAASLMPLQATQAALYQFTQALRSGVFQGEELRAVLEGMPDLAEAIAKGMGIPLEELRKRAQSGSLETKKVIAGIIKSAPQIEARYKQVGVTFEGAFANLNTSLNLLGKGIIQAMGGGENSVAKFINNVALAIGNFGKRLPSYVLDIQIQMAVFADTITSPFDYVYEQLKSIFKKIAGLIGSVSLSKISGDMADGLKSAISYATTLKDTVFQIYEKISGGSGKALARLNAPKVGKGSDDDGLDAMSVAHDVRPLANLEMSPVHILPTLAAGVGTLILSKFSAVPTAVITALKVGLITSLPKTIGELYFRFANKDSAEFGPRATFGDEGLAAGKVATGLLAAKFADIPGLFQLGIVKLIKTLSGTNMFGGFIKENGINGKEISKSIGTFAKRTGIMYAAFSGLTYLGAKALPKKSPSLGEVSGEPGTFFNGKKTIGQSTGQYVDTVWQTLKAGAEEVVKFVKAGWDWLMSKIIPPVVAFGDYLKKTMDSLSASSKVIAEIWRVLKTILGIGPYKGTGPNKNDKERPFLHDTLNLFPQEGLFKTLVLSATAIGAAIAVGFMKGVIPGVIAVPLGIATAGVFGMLINNSIESATIEKVTGEAASGILSVLTNILDFLTSGKLFGPKSLTEFAQGTKALLLSAAGLALLFKSGREKAQSYGVGALTSGNRLGNLAFNASTVGRLERIARERKEAFEAFGRAQKRLDDNAAASLKELARPANAGSMTAARRLIENAPAPGANQLTRQAYNDRIAARQNEERMADQVRVAERRALVSGNRASAVRGALDEGRDAFRNSLIGGGSVAGGLIGTAIGFKLGEDMIKGFFADAEPWEQVGIQLASAFGGQLIGSGIGASLGALIGVAFSASVLPWLLAAAATYAGVKVVLDDVLGQKLYEGIKNLFFDKLPELFNDVKRGINKATGFDIFDVKTPEELKATAVSMRDVSEQRQRVKSVEGSALLDFIGEVTGTGVERDPRWAKEREELVLKEKELLAVLEDRKGLQSDLNKEKALMRRRQAGAKPLIPSTEAGQLRDIRYFQSIAGSQTDPQNKALIQEIISLKQQGLEMQGYLGGLEKTLPTTSLTPSSSGSVVLKKTPLIEIPPTVVDDLNIAPGKSFFPPPLPKANAPVITPETVKYTGTELLNVALAQQTAFLAKFPGLKVSNKIPKGHAGQFDPDNNIIYIPELKESRTLMADVLVMIHEFGHVMDLAKDGWSPQNTQEQNRMNLHKAGFTYDDASGDRLYREAVANEYAIKNFPFPSQKSLEFGQSMARDALLKIPKEPLVPTAKAYGNLKKAVEVAGGTVDALNNLKLPELSTLYTPALTVPLSKVVGGAVSSSLASSTFGHSTVLASASGKPLPQVTVGSSKVPQAEIVTDLPPSVDFDPNYKVGDPPRKSPTSTQDARTVTEPIVTAVEEVKKGVEEQTREQVAVRKEIFKINGNIQSFRKVGGGILDAEAARIPEKDRMRVFLDTIGSLESGNAYDIRYDGKGGSKFDTSKGHPNKPEKILNAKGEDTGLVSTAAGRWQVLWSTWQHDVPQMIKDGLKADIKDFSPAAQNQWMNWKLGKLGATEHIAKGEWSAATAATGNTWSAMPGANNPDSMKGIQAYSRFAATAAGAAGNKPLDSTHASYAYAKDKTFIEDFDLTSAFTAAFRGEMDWATITSEIKRRGLDLVKHVIPSMAAAMGITIPGLASAAPKPPKPPKIPSFSEVAKGLTFEELKDKLNEALADNGITVDLKGLGKLAGDQLNVFLSKVDALLSGKKNNPISNSVGGVMNKAAQENLATEVLNAYLPKNKTPLSEKLRLAKTDDEQIELINEALQGIGKIDATSLKALGDGFEEFIQNIESFEAISDTSRTSRNVQLTDRARNRLKTQLIPLQEGKVSKTYTREASNAGYAMADGIYGDFTKGLSAFAKGQVKGKTALKAILDGFTNSVIDTVIGGFTKNLFGPDSVIYTAMSDLGKGLFDMGETGGGFLDNLLKPSIPVDPKSAAVVSTINTTSNTQVSWLARIYSALTGKWVTDGVKTPTLEDLKATSFSVPNTSSWFEGMTDESLSAGLTKASTYGEMPASFGNPLGGFSFGDPIISAFDTASLNFADTLNNNKALSGEEMGTSLKSIFSKDGGLGGIFDSIKSFFKGSGEGGGGFDFMGMIRTGLGFFGLAGGGQVSGAGTGTSDSLLAMLSNGEFVVNAKSTAKFRPLLHAINNNDIPKFAVGGIAGSEYTSVAPAAAAASNNVSTKSTVVNIQITGDISRQTKKEIYGMLPTIAAGVNSHNREKGYR